MFAKRFVLFLFSLVCFSQAANALPYSSVVVYGDSLSDNGNLYAASGGTVPAAPYFNGRRSNGPVAVEYLAQSLGVPLSDRAWIGATTGDGNYADGGTVTSLGAFNLPGMTTWYNTTKSPMDPLSSGLFVVWAGPNDFLAPSSSDVTAIDTINRAVGNIVSIVADLQLRGAYRILVPGMPDLGLTPEFQSDAPAYTGLTNIFNTALLAALPSGVSFFDTASLMRQVVANPGAFGLANVTDACFDGITVCSDPQEYLFYDSFHPTTAAHAIIGRGFLLAVPEPSTLPLIGLGLALLVWTHRQHVFVSRAKA